MNKVYRSLLISILFLFAVNAPAEEKTGFADIKQLAEQGNAEAQAKLGAIYHLGDSVQLPPTARFKTKSQYKSIAYLLEGIGRDEKKASSWMLKAVAQDVVEAEVFMAAMYDRGMGVKQSTSEATRLYQKAGKHGNETAQAILGRYAQSRLVASKDIPLEYALKILTKK